VDNNIRIRWSGGERSYSPGTVVRFGREPSNEIALVNTNVSRHHAQLEYIATGWVIHDTGSAQGVWLNGSRISSVPISGVCSVSMGQPPNGEMLEFTVAGNDNTRIGVESQGTELPGSPPYPSPPTSGVAGFESAGTVVVGASPDRPGGRLREGALAGATVVTGNALNLECAGVSYSFQPGQIATIGRDESSDVMSTNPTVSRHHARVRHDGTGWLLEDGGSSSGTFVDGRRISQLRLAGSVAAWLGSEETGERIVMVTSGTHVVPKGSRPGQAPQKKGPILVVALIAVIALIAAGAAIYVTQFAGPDNDELARGTVLITTVAIVTVDGLEVPIKGQGSGTIVDAAKGLILTNAHVANPDVEGLDPVTTEDGTVVPNPQQIVISVTPGLDKSAEPKYLAEVKAVDGYLDLAVLKITKTIGGQFIEDGDLDELTSIDLADSDTSSTGDRISVFGFPTAAEASTVTLSSGVIGGPVGDNDLKTNRAFLNIDARISPGNSGGLAANDDGELIGVPTIIRGGEVGSMRPVNFALPLMKAARAGETYKTPYG